jgi:hypothetical protein
MRVIILDEIQHPMRSVPGLSEVWVRLHGLPAILLEPSRLLAATTMIAKPLHVDELSLVKEPSGVLMKFATPVPQKMRMSVVLYVNGVGAKVEVVPEDPKSGFAESQPPPPPPRGPDDKDDQEEEEDNDTELTGSDVHWKHRKSSSAVAPPPSKEQPPNAPRSGRQKTLAHKPKTSKRKISFPRGKPPQRAEFASAPAACPASPVISTPVSVSSKLLGFNEYGSNLTCSPTFAAKLAAVASPAPPSPPHKKTISLVSVSSQDEGEEVCNFTADKASKLSDAERQEIGWESPDEWEFENETLAERCKKLNLRRPFQKLSNAKKKALMQESPVLPVAPEPKISASAPPLECLSPSSKISSTGVSPPKVAPTPSSSARCSARTQGSKSESILQKAVRVTAEKNAPGMSSLPSLVSSDFVLLSARSDAHLIAVAADVGLAINPSVGSPEELLSLVRAKEVAQALLAAAVEKKRSTAPPKGAGVASPQPSAVGARAAPALPIVTDAQGGG